MLCSPGKKNSGCWDFPPFACTKIPSNSCKIAGLLLSSCSSYSFFSTCSVIVPLPAHTITVSSKVPQRNIMLNKIHFCCNFTCFALQLPSRNSKHGSTLLTRKAFLQQEPKESTDLYKPASPVAVSQVKHSCFGIWETQNHDYQAACSSSNRKQPQEGILEHAPQIRDDST